MTDAPEASRPASLVNRVLADRYDLLEAIGEGPLLAAYRARDRALNRIVAVKALLPRYGAKRDVRERLTASLGQVLALSHPAIVRAYDVGTDPAAGSDGNSLLFLAEEYVRGIDLKERIRRAAPLQLSAATETAIAVAEALEYAHARGVVHGDVRPHNILAGPDNQVKLTGFGAADAQSLVIADDSENLKRVVPYIAPDAARAAAPTASGDLYALGCVLFEMLTGELPYKAPNALQIALRHVQDPIPSPKTINAAIPRALDGVVQKALGKRPEERYASATELLTDLRQVRDALRYGRSLDWTPRHAGEEAPMPPPAPVEDATIAGAVLPPPPILPLETPAAAPLGVAPPPPPPPTATPPAEQTLVMPVMGTSAATVAANRRVAAIPETMPTTAASASPYVNSATGTVTSHAAAAYVEDDPEPVKDYPRGGGGNRWLLSLNLFLFLLALGGIGGLVWLTFHSLSPASEVTVPNLVGRSLTEAKQLAAEQNFVLAIVDQQYRDNEPSGDIYQMQPAPGRHIRQGKSISVWVSKGPRMVDVPDVRSTSLEKARRVIEAANLRVGNYTFEFDSLEAKGNVIRQDPSPGETLPRGKSVNLVLSKGEEPPPTPLPDLPPPPDTTFTPVPDPITSGTDATPEPSSSSEEDSDTKVRTFDTGYDVPKDNAPHRIRIDITDKDGTRTVFDESRKAGDKVRQRVEGVGKAIRIRLFDNDVLKGEQVPKAN